MNHIVLHALFTSREDDDKSGLGDTVMSIYVYDASTSPRDAKARSL
jgi:hypothetical protein